MGTYKHTNTSNNQLTIDCKDIILREYKVEDLDEMVAITHEPEVIEFLPDWNAPKEQRAEWLVKYEIVENSQFIKVVAEGGNIEELRLRLAIILKETGEFIGWCCTGIKEELPPPNREIMYAISNKYANKGYATQAVQGVVKYLFENTNVEELITLALIDNVASNRVIQKCGFEYENVIEIDNEKFNYYRLATRINGTK